MKKKFICIKPYTWLGIHNEVIPVFKKGDIYMCVTTTYADSNIIYDSQNIPRYQLNNKNFHSIFISIDEHRHNVINTILG